VRNKGLELTLSTFNLIGEFKWNTDFNIAFNRNKVLKLDDLGNDIILSRSQIVDGIISVGYDMNTWYLRKWLGVDPQTGDPLWEKVTTDENGNEVRTSTNVYSEATMQKIGGMSPKFTGGITNTFSYKRISLSVFFNFVQGNQILHRSRQTYDSDGFYDRTNAMVLADGWSRWQKPGDVATHPKPVMGGNKNAALLSTRYLENGSFIRMRNVSISYVLPTTFLQNLRISNARIFVSGDNLWTLTKFSGLDPEVIIGPIQGGGTTNYSSDMDYPISKKILFGLNVEF
jgi:hypothetical protein